MIPITWAGYILVAYARSIMWFMDFNVFDVWCIQGCQSAGVSLNKYDMDLELHKVCE